MGGLGASALSDTGEGPAVPQSERAFSLGLASAASIRTRPHLHILAGSHVVIPFNLTLTTFASAPAAATTAPSKGASPPSELLTVLASAFQ